MIRKKLLWALAAFVGVLALSGCGGGGNAEADKGKGLFNYQGTVGAGGGAGNPNPSAPAAKRWVDVWSFAPQPLKQGSTATDIASSAPVPLVLSQSVVRLIIKPTAPGQTLRLQLSNIFGTGATAVENVYIGIHQGGGVVKPGTHVPVTFDGGKNSLTLEQKDYYSDAVTLPYQFGEELAITMYLSGAHSLVTGHVETNQNAYIAGGAAATSTSQEGVTAFGTKWIGSVYLTGLQSSTSDTRSSLLVVGDSITDGTDSDVDTNTRYSDFLAKRVQNTPGLDVQSILNMGIGGNQLLKDGNQVIGGGNALLNRLEHDVLTPGNVKYVILMIGTNDIGGSNGTVSYDELIAGYTQVASRLKAKGIKAYISPITPARNTTLPILHFSPQAQALRTRVNDWIRSNTVFDGVIDFAKAVRDPADPERILPEFDSGDGLHPNSKGYSAMADAVPLELFKLK